jgi:hypothetical protein
VPVSNGAALFLYQLPLSAYQIEQAKTANVRITQRCESGNGENPAKIKVRHSCESDDGRKPAPVEACNE